MATKSPVYEDYVNEPNNKDFNNIPGDDGLPIIGHTHRFYGDPFVFAQQQYAKYGPICKVKALNGSGIMAMGPDLMKEILLDTDKNFSSRMAYFDRVGTFFSGGVIMADFDDHKYQRRLLQTAFKVDSLHKYTHEVNKIYDNNLAEWESKVGDTTPFFLMIKKVLLEVAAKLFIGIEGRGETAEEINEAFEACLRGMMYIFPFRLPGFAYHNGLKGKAYLQNLMGSLIEEKRAGNATDMLSHICREKNDEGEYFTNDQIINQAIFLLFAAHDTTTAAITYTIYFLAKNPDVKQRLYEECLSIGKENLEYDDLDKLTYMQQVFFEVQRGRTSTPMVPRRTIRETTLAGIKIPAHTMLYTVPGFTNYMEEYWENPEKFDPDRFSEERNEHKKHPYMFHPFGGGAHKCIGMHFSQMEYKCFMYKFLLKYDFEGRHKKEPKMVALPLPRPVDNMPIEIFLRK